MALLSRLLGHASDLTPEQTREELDGILLPEEPVEVAFKVIRDLFVFTDRRLILVDKQGVTSRKIDYLVVPYRAITSYSIETAESGDRDAEGSRPAGAPDGCRVRIRADFRTAAPKRVAGAAVREVLSRGFVQ